MIVIGCWPSSNTTRDVSKCPLWLNLSLFAVNHTLSGAGCLAPFLPCLHHITAHLFRDDDYWPLGSSLFYLGLLPPLLPPDHSPSTLTGFSVAWHIPVTSLPFGLPRVFGASSSDGLVLLPLPRTLGSALVFEVPSRARLCLPTFVISSVLDFPFTSSPFFPFPSSPFSHFSRFSLFFSCTFVFPCTTEPSVRSQSLFRRVVIVLQDGFSCCGRYGLGRR